MSARSRRSAGRRALGHLTWAVCLVTAWLWLAPDPHASSPTPTPDGQSTSPTRIVSIVPAVTEMIFAMGAGSKVVGVSSFDAFPPEAAQRPKVGALIDPDFERILSLKPDLVVVYGTQDELIGRLTRVGLPIFNYRHAGLSDITATIRAIGERIGRGADGDRLARKVDADLEAVRASVAGRPRPRTVLLFGREPGTLRSMYASAGVGFMHDMLEVAGGTDVFADVKRESVQLSAELLLARAPEVVLEVHPADGWTADKIVRERGVWRSLPSVPAVRSGRIYILADDRFAIPGPRVAEAARLMADVLHPR